MVIIREAVEKDNQQLLELERITSHGGLIQLGYDKRDFFLKAKRFDKYQVLVAEDDGLIVGTGCGGIKDTLLNGVPYRVCSQFDVRFRMDYGYKYKKGFYNLVSENIRWMNDHDVSMAYVLTKADDRDNLSREHKRGYVIINRIRFSAFPVYRKRKVTVDNFRFDENIILDKINAGNRHLPLYFNRDDIKSPSFYSSISVESGNSFAGCRIWDPQKEIIIHKMPVPLLALSHITRMIAGLYPLPCFPKPGQRIKYWILSDIVCSGTDGARLFREVVNKTANLALSEKIDIMLIPLCSGDGLVNEFRGLITPGFDYYVMGKVLKGENPGELDRIDLDVRDF